MTYDTYNAIINSLTAIGTVGATIVALWFGYRDGKPKLIPSATIGILFPDNIEYLWISCLNSGKQQIICESFSIQFRNTSLRKYFFLLPSNLLSTEYQYDRLPIYMDYSKRIHQYYYLKIFEDPIFKQQLFKNKFLAKIQIKLFFKIVAVTNIKKFRSKLSDSIVNNILSKSFTENNFKK